MTAEWPFPATRKRREGSSEINVNKKLTYIFKGRLDIQEIQQSVPSQSDWDIKDETIHEQTYFKSFATTSDKGKEDFEGVVEG